MFDSPESVAIGLRNAGYATDVVLVQIIWLATRMQKPILIEGRLAPAKLTWRKHSQRRRGRT